MTATPGSVELPPSSPDELSLCDEDIQQVFRGKQYFIGTPTMAQLVKEIRLLREELQRQRQ